MKIGYRRESLQLIVLTKEKMERVKGLEPSTFTLATWSPVFLARFETPLESLRNGLKYQKSQKKFRLPFFADLCASLTNFEPFCQRWCEKSVNTRRI